MKGTVERVARLTIFSTAVIAYAVAIAHYFVRRGAGTIPPEWAFDLSIVGILSFALSVVLFFSARRRRRTTIVLVVRIFLFNIMSAPAARDPVIVYSLALCLFVEIGYYLSFPRNLVAASVGVVVSSAFYSFYRLIGVSFSLDLAYEALALLLLVIGAGMFAGILRFLSDAFLDKEREIGALNSALVQLTNANAGFLKYASSIERTAVLSERKRITRDLHDIVGQTFTNIIAMMDAVLRRPIEDGLETNRLHQWTRDHAQEGLQQTRAVLYQLRALPESELSGSQAVKNLASTFEQSTGVKVELEWTNLSMVVSSDVNVAVYHVIQEALVNALRHGKATRVRITFWKEQSDLCLTIRDNGAGGDQGTKGIGHAGMEERILNLGGSIAFENVADGYRVSVRIPTAMTA